MKSHVTVADINANMLEVGQVRVKRRGCMKKRAFDIEWLQGNAKNLSLNYESFTVYNTSFNKSRD